MDWDLHGDGAGVNSGIREEFRSSISRCMKDVEDR